MFCVWNLYANATTIIGQSNIKWISYVVVDLAEKKNQVFSLRIAQVYVQYYLKDL